MSIPAPGHGHVGGAGGGEPSSPKAGPPGPIPQHIMNPPAGHPHPRRASLAQKRMEEMSGEEGPSGLDSPTFVAFLTSHLVRARS